ncbi:hypothetical protein DFH09DRAFT_1372488 [Mycena vulgaris]|nr:hypothetical protein DFH09DRAFT_1372488 [Mycena vulgaris]
MEAELNSRTPGVNRARAPEKATLSSDARSLSSPTTRPPPNLTNPSHPCLVRCKSIKPLAITKLSVSPVPRLLSLQRRRVCPSARGRPLGRRRRLLRRACGRIHHLRGAPPASLPTPSSFSVPPSRPPPRTPVPTDAQSGDYTLLAASLSPLLSPGPFSARSASPSPLIVAWVLELERPSPRGPPLPAPLGGVRVQARIRRPALAVRRARPWVLLPSSSLPSPIEEGECSPIEYAAADADEKEQENGCTYFPPTPRTPHHQGQNEHGEQRALRSRWSSSTLSSVHSAHAHVHAPRSPRTFAFAGQYFPFAAPAAYPPRANLGRALGGKKGKGKRLTAADVARISGEQDKPEQRIHATAQFASYPYSPSFYPYSASPASAALYAAYTAQRPPRRRASAASSSRSDSSVWNSEQSESGHSEFSVASAGGEGEGGLRGKPIPVGLFLR